MDAFRKITGFNDIYGEKIKIYTEMETIAREIFARYVYREIRTPIVEFTGLFQRSIGDSTDVVQKEMYTFKDKSEHFITLRPEATAGIMRAVIENGWDKSGQIEKLFTIGPMFRYERPQKGRLRQFHQINCECVGSSSPLIDGEIICMLLSFLNELKIGELKLKINSLGCKQCRPLYMNNLKSFFEKIDQDEICEDCKKRIEINPLRVLDCKQDKCRKIFSEVPEFKESLCVECNNHFNEVLEILEKQHIQYEIDSHLVRGLDYYMRTTFEVVSENIGSQTAVAGGGRYDGLVSTLGGRDIPGIGFACGMERLCLLMGIPDKKRPDFYLLCPDEKYMIEAFSFLETLRKHNLTGEMNYRSGSFKSLMRQASKSEARFCLILGENEINEESISIKNMETSTQENLKRKNLEEIISKVKNWE